MEFVRLLHRSHEHAFHPSRRCNCGIKANSSYAIGKAAEQDPQAENALAGSNSRDGPNWLHHTPDASDFLFIWCFGHHDVPR